MSFLDALAFPALSDASLKGDDAVTGVSSLMGDEWQTVATSARKKKTNHKVDEAPITSTPYVPAKPRELTEEEKQDNEIFEGLYDALKTYVPLYTESITKLKVGKTPLFYLAIAMISYLISILDEIKTSIADTTGRHKALFARTLIKGLYSVTIYDKDGNEKDEVNIIEMLFSFVEICLEHNNSHFKAPTFGAHISRPAKERFNFNYHLSFAESDLTIGDCSRKFVVLFKAFRTTLASRIINKCTGSYKVPQSENPWDDWAYYIYNKDVGGFDEFQSEEFFDFMQKVAPIYEAIDKLPENLSFISDMFVEAKEAVNADRLEREKRKQDRAMREFNKTLQNRTRRGPTNRSQTYNEVRTRKPKSQPQQKPKPQENIIRAPIGPTISWGGFNPVTAQTFVPRVAAVPFEPVYPAQPVQPAPVVNTNTFTQVRSRNQKQAARSQAWKEKQNEQNEKSPSTLSHSRSRAEAWRKKNSN